MRRAPLVSLATTQWPDFDLRPLTQESNAVILIQPFAKARDCYV